ncbi:hypothetical protein Syun_020854 [Stephania yunnanensis]|uniref:Uncharacterized protein n=1 Tax=Stephania yunnanensis TaxID=152371 RepID=A0AAP0IEY8_9MAGN
MATWACLCAHVGDLADLTSGARDQVSGQLDATTGGNSVTRSIVLSTGMSKHIYILIRGLITGLTRISSFDEIGKCDACMNLWKLMYIDIMLYLSETSDRSKKIFKLNQELQSSLMEENAEKLRFKEECEKLKEENTMLRDTHKMEILKGILAHKAFPDYLIELKDFMIENGEFLITNGWNKCVTHLKHKYLITDEETKDLDSLDVEEDASTSTTIQGEDQLS